MQSLQLTPMVIVVPRRCVADIVAYTFAMIQRTPPRRQKSPAALDLESGSDRRESGGEVGGT